jgi:hypothetical protein
VFVIVPENVPNVRGRMYLSLYRKMFQMLGAECICLVPENVFYMFVSLARFVVWQYVHATSSF